MATRGPGDAYVDEVVERALAPYADKVPAAVLEEMRAAMREDLLAHPLSAKLINRLRPRPALPHSDDIEVEPGWRTGAVRGKAGDGSGGGP